MDVSVPTSPWADHLSESGPAPEWAQQGHQKRAHLRVVPSPPVTLSHEKTALCIVVRSPKAPQGALCSWWTPDALDGQEWSSAHGWYQVGFLLHTAVYLEEVEGRNPPRPGPIKFWQDVSRAAGDFYGGGAVEVFKNPDASHIQYPVTVGRAKGFTLKEIKDMVMSDEDRRAAGRRSSSEKKKLAVQTNLGAARSAKSEAAGARYARILTYLDAGLTVAQVAVVEDITRENAKKLCQRVRKWQEAQP